MRIRRSPYPAEFLGAPCSVMSTEIGHRTTGSTTVCQSPAIDGSWLTDRKSGTLCADAWAAYTWAAYV